jgi:phospholipid N-methyltransferase
MKHIARKRFGQNFLTDDGVLHQIIRGIGPGKDDVMVEIGPGLAAMTNLLLQAMPHMHVVELDRDLVARLKKSYPAERLTVHEGDALKFDFLSIPVPEGKNCALSVICRTTFPVPCCFTLRRFLSTYWISILCCRKKWSSAWWPSRVRKCMAVYP